MRTWKIALRLKISNIKKLDYSHTKTGPQLYKTRTYIVVRNIVNNII